MIIGLIVNYLPKLPAFLATRGNFESSLTVFLFEVDAALYFFSFIALLFVYVSHGLESRIVPEAESRLTRITYWITMGFFAALILVHFRIAAEKYGFVRWAAFSIGIWFGANTFIGLWKTVNLIWGAKKNKIPVPQFRFIAFRQDWTCLLVACVSLAMGIFASYCLWRVLNGTQNWLYPLRAATVALSCSILTIFLFGRSLKLASQATYDALERDIVLIKLSPMEIKLRFEKQILGRNIADWLDELLKTLEMADGELKSICDSVRQKTQEIFQIDPSYADERAARAKKARNELFAGMEQYKLQSEKFGFQLRSFLKDYNDEKGIEIVNRWVEQFKSRSEKSMKILDECKSLATPLHELIPQEK